MMINQDLGKAPNTKHVSKNLGFVIIAIVVIVAAVAAAGWWFLSQSTMLQSPSQTPSAPRSSETKSEAVAPTPNDSTASITDSFKSIDTGNLNQEFQNINDDLNSL